MGGFEVVATIFVVALFMGIAFFVATSMHESEMSYWELTPLEKISCEQMADFLGGYNTERQNGEKFEKTLIIEDRWDEANCSDTNSAMWKGDDWEYTPTVQDTIDRVEKNIEGIP